RLHLHFSLPLASAFQLAACICISACRLHLHFSLPLASAFQLAACICISDCRACICISACRLHPHFFSTSVRYRERGNGCLPFAKCFQ
ncbi:MAG: hypothetical protein RBQ94_00755, partial [Methanimicrococcus sp.]|nr:hypothetical protein [Methanimicrococcus sp.]